MPNLVVQKASQCLYIGHMQYLVSNNKVGWSSDAGCSLAEKFNWGEVGCTVTHFCVPEMRETSDTTTTTTTTTTTNYYYYYYYYYLLQLCYYSVAVVILHVNKT